MFVRTLLIHQWYTRRVPLVSTAADLRPEGRSQPATTHAFDPGVAGNRERLDKRATSSRPTGSATASRGVRPSSAGDRLVEPPERLDPEATIDLALDSTRAPHRPPASRLANAPVRRSETPLRVVRAALLGYLRGRVDVSAA